MPATRACICVPVSRWNLSADAARASSAMAHRTAAASNAKRLFIVGHPALGFLDCSHGPSLHMPVRVCKDCIMRYIDTKHMYQPVLNEQSLHRRRNSRFGGSKHHCRWWFWIVARVSTPATVGGSGVQPLIISHHDPSSFSQLAVGSPLTRS